MIGNITNRFFSDKEKCPLIWAVLIIIVLIVLVLLLCHSCGNDNTTENRPKDLPEVVVNGDDDGYTEDNHNGIQIDTTTGLIMRADTKAQEFELGNPKNNECAMIISIYLADGTKLYQSDYIYPGGCIGQVNINRVLRRGTYKNAILVFECYEISEPHDPITQSQFQIEIQCL